MVSDPMVAQDQSPPTVRVALERYVASLPEGKAEKDFLAVCYDPTKPTTAEDAFNLLQRLESQDRVPLLSKIIRRVVVALKDYDALISSLVSADPMPTAVIWGALSVIIKGAQRHFDMLDGMRSHLRELESIISRFRDYEVLDGDCPELRRLLIESYVNIFRFLSLVHKTMTKSGIKSLVSAVSSKASDALQDVVGLIKGDADAIESQFIILEAKRVRQEQIAAQMERDLQVDWRDKREAEKLKSTILKWLNKQDVTEANLKRYEIYQREKMEGSCEKICSNSKIVEWLDHCGSHPTLLLCAGPGSGKSFLCAHVIQLVQRRSQAPDCELKDRDSVAFHFYRFDEYFDGHEVLRHISLQLFTDYSSSQPQLSCLRTLNDIIQDARLGPDARARIFLTALVEHLPAVYIFLDGLDEESGSQRQKEASSTVSFLLDLSKKYSPKFRLWSSSQMTECVRQIFPGYGFLEADSDMRPDVTSYLDAKISALELGGSKQELDVMLENMDANAAGSFLWANLMVQELEKASSLSHRRRLIAEGPTLDQYYEKFFKRLDQSDCNLACQLFSLIAFARRPLRLKELREAIGILSPDRDMTRIPNVPDLNDDEKPFIPSLKRLFSPLIIFDGASVQEEDGFCRLYHSTLLHFLYRNPDIFCQHFGHSTSLHLNPRTIANSCLLYLSQSRYSKLLTKDTAGDQKQWVDRHENSVENHYFLSYAAKHWDRHFDWRHDDCVSHHLLKTGEPCPECKTLYDPSLILSFLTSPNFQTCIQVQSVFIDFHFSIRSTMQRRNNTLYIRRVFPNWLEKDVGDYHRRAYHIFQSQWVAVLNFNFISDDPAHTEFVGEVDRCWWGALGKKSFLSKFQGRHASFRLENKSENLPNSFLGIADDGKEFRTVTFDMEEDGTLIVNIDFWRLANNRATNLRSQTFRIEHDPSIWEQYLQVNAPGSRPRNDRAPAVQFGPNCGTLRIGSRVFVFSGGHYVPLATPHSVHSYIEESCSRGKFVGFARRQRPLKASELAASHSAVKDGFLDLSPISSDLGGNLKDNILPSKDDDKNGCVRRDAHENPRCAHGKEMNTTKPMQPSKQKGASPDSDSHSDEEIYESSEESDDSYGCAEAYQSWSECSSADVHEGYASSSEDDDAAADQSDGEIGSSVMACGRSYSQDSDEENYADDDQDHDYDSGFASDSEDEDEDIDPRVFGYGQISRYGEVYMDSDNEENIYRTYLRSTERNDRGSPLVAQLCVFDTSESLQDPRLIFRFSRPLAFPLYHSPPVIHPTHPLVVWPLTAGDILFGDLKENSYFERKIVPSTSSARQIFMKCYFSRCGKFLHIAALEGQQADNTLAAQDENGGEKPGLSELPADVEEDSSDDEYPIVEPEDEDEDNKDEEENSNDNDDDKGDGGDSDAEGVLTGVRANPESNEQCGCSETTKVAQSLVVYTYRLCASQPTRAPPSFVRKSRLDLGLVHSIPINRPPFTLTWTDEALYVTCRSRVLRLYKIDLGHSEASTTQLEDPEFPITRPQETVVLPYSRLTRDVYFFPARESEKATVLIGNKDLLYPSPPPIGCLLDEEKDLGGWVRSAGTQDVPDHRGNGRLTQSLEQFDPDVDCDLELFVFLD